MTQPGRRPATWWRRALARRRTRVVLVLVVLVVAMRAVLPYAVRRIAVEQADRALVGRVEIDDVDLAVVTGGVTLHGVRVFATERRDGAPAVTPVDTPAASGERAAVVANEPPGDAPPGDAPVLSAKRLSVDISWLALLRKVVEVKAIELDDFAVSVDRGRDGTLVLPAAVPAAEPATPQPAASPGWGVLVRRVMLRDGRAGFRDFAVGETPQHLDVTLPTVDAANLALLITDGGIGPGTLTLDAGLRDGTLHVAATIEQRAAGPALETHLVLANLPIGDARLYVPYVGWSDLAGRLDTDLVHRFESGGAHTVRGKLALRDVAVHVPDLDQPAVSWRTLAVDLRTVDVTKQHADVASIVVDGARVVTRPGGPEPVPVLHRLVTAAAAKVAPDAIKATVMASPAAPRMMEAGPTPADAVRVTPAAVAAGDTAAPEPTAAPPEAVSPSARPWTWTVASVLLKDGGVQAIGGDAPLDLAVEAEVANVASTPGTPSTVQLTIAPASGGKVAVTAAVTLQPLGFDGSVRIDPLPLPPLIAPVANAQTRLLKSGTVDANLQIVAGAAPDAPRDGARVAGTLRVADLDVRGDDATRFALRWRELAFAIRELTAPGILAPAAAAPAPITVALSRLSWSRPELVATRTADGIALPAALAGSPSPSPSPASTSARAPKAAPTPTPGSKAARAPAAVPSSGPPAVPVTVRAERLAIDRMALTVSDETVQPFYRSTLDPVNVVASDVRWPGPFARDLKLDAKGLDGATFTLTGNVAPADSQLVAKLDALPLSPFNPYAASSGYAVAGGTARLESTIKLGRGTYDTNSKLVLNKLAVSGSAGESAFASQFGMPLALALALLTDVQGNIVLNLPVAGDEQGMRLGLGTIVGDALAHAILNAVTSPLKLLGALGSIGDKPVAAAPAPIAFLPGRAELASGEDQKIRQLGSVLAAAPGLALHVRGEAAAEDRRWLAEQALRAELADQSGVVSSLRHIGERGPRRAALDVLTTRASGGAAEIPPEHAAWFEEQVARQSVPDAAVTALAESRAREVQSRLTAEAGVAAARVVIDATAAEDLAARPAVAVGLGAPPARLPPS